MPSNDQNRVRAGTRVIAHDRRQQVAQAVVGFTLGLAVLFLLSLQTTPAFSAGPVGYEDEESVTNESFARAVKMVDRGSYATAIALLEKAIAADPRNPDAYSLMGFSHRKLGEWGAALDYYNKALELDPKHLGANEYLGELYLEMDDLERAMERLGILKAACGTDCAEYQQLKNAVAAFKAGS